LEVATTSNDKTPVYYRAPTRYYPIWVTVSDLRGPKSCACNVWR